MKRFLSFILALTLAVSLVPSAFAASDEAVQAANALHALGLFNGTGTDANGNPVYDLERAPTREEAITMLVRLLGREEEAKSDDWRMPFTDVSNWAKPYVGYAYTYDLTSGTSETTFGGKQKVSATQYLTFVLRALHYEDGTDFQWNRAWKLSDEIGLTSAQYTSDSSITRGDVATISLKALSVLNKYDTTLLDELLDYGPLTSEKIKTSGINVSPNFNYEDTKRIDYIKDGEKYYRLCDGTLYTYDFYDFDDVFEEVPITGGLTGHEVSCYFDRYTGDPYLTVDSFAALVTLFSGNYNGLIHQSDKQTSQFASGVLWLTQRNIKCSYQFQRKEVSLNVYRTDVNISYKNKNVKFYLIEPYEQSSPELAKELSASVYQQTGMKCIAVYAWLPYWTDGFIDGHQPAFNVYELLDYFGITDPVIRDKFENIQVKNIDGTDVLIVN